MTKRYNPDVHHRRSIRLQGYDYRQIGAYFVTICTLHRICLFGDVVDGEMRLNALGRMVETEWLQTPSIRPNVELDAFVVMPNHFHAIVVIVDDYRAVNRGGVLQYGRMQYAPTFWSPSQTIGAIIRGFKSAITKHINDLRDTPGVPVWQRNYYEHIIRNEEDLNRARDYIANNPTQWMEDETNPVYGKL
jgi:putative transposase